MRSFNISVAIAACLLAAAPTISAPTPVDPDRVGRAVALSRIGAAEKIRNGRVQPMWIKGRDIFWYRRDAETGQVASIVDAPTGARRDAYDREAVAAALKPLTMAPVDPLKLPVTAISLGEADIVTATFTLGKDKFDCRIATPVACAPAIIPDPSLALSPDGSRAILVRAHNLWLRDMKTGAERQLTTTGAENNAWATMQDTVDQGFFRRLASTTPRAPYQVHWSPDGRKLLVPQIDQRHVEPYPFAATSPRDGSFRPKVQNIRFALAGEVPALTTWNLIDIETGGIQPIAHPGDVMARDEAGRNLLAIWWKPDSSAVFQLANAWDASAGYLFRVDAATGQVRTLVKDGEGLGAGINIFFAGNYSPPAARLVSDGREVIHYSVRDGHGHLYRIDSATGRLINRITRGKWQVRDILHVDEARRQVIFSAAGREPGNPYHRYIYRAGFDGRGLTLISAEPGDHLVVDPAHAASFDGTRGYQPVSPSGDYIVYDVSTVSTPTISQIRRTRDGSLVSTFERADASALLAAGYRPPEEFTAKSADGKHDLHGLVFRPSDYDPKRKYAVIDLQYGSPHVAITPRSFVAAATSPLDTSTAAATAELGFIVFIVDAPGTPFRSLAFSRSDPGYLADMGLKDHVAYLKALAAHDPAVDLNRVGISGYSYGGWTSIRALIDYPDIFKVGVAGVAPGGFHSMYTAPGLTSPEGQARYEGGALKRPTPSSRPVNFAAFDSSLQVDRIRGKLLMVVGEQDEAVLPGSSLQFYHAAIRADRDVDLIYVPNAGHTGVYTGHVTRRTWALWLREFNNEILAPDARIKGMSPE